MARVFGNHDTFKRDGSDNTPWWGIFVLSTKNELQLVGMIALEGQGTGGDGMGHGDGTGAASGSNGGGAWVSSGSDGDGAGASSGRDGNGAGATSGSDGGGEMRS